MANRLKFTPKAQEKFLDRLMMGDTMVEAAQAIGVAVRTVYDHKLQNEEFAALIEMANEVGAETNLLPVARDHAKDGWLENVYHEGKVVGQVRKYDHGLLWRLLQVKIKAYRPPQKNEIELGPSLAAVLASFANIKDKK